MSMFLWRVGWFGLGSLAGVSLYVVNLLYDYEGGFFVNLIAALILGVLNGVVLSEFAIAIRQYRNWRRIRKLPGGVELRREEEGWVALVQTIGGEPHVLRVPEEHDPDHTETPDAMRRWLFEQYGLDIEEVEEPASDT